MTLEQIAPRVAVGLGFDPTRKIREATDKDLGLPQSLALAMSPFCVPWSLELNFDRNSGIEVGA